MENFNTKMIGLANGTTATTSKNDRFYHSLFSLTSRHDADSFAHLDKRSKQYQHVRSNSRFDLHSQKRVTVVFENKAAGFVHCLRKSVCMRPLIGRANLSAGGRLQVCTSYEQSQTEDTVSVYKTDIKTQSVVKPERVLLRQNKTVCKYSVRSHFTSY